MADQTEPTQPVARTGHWRAIPLHGGGAAILDEEMSVLIETTAERAQTLALVHNSFIEGAPETTVRIARMMLFGEFIKEFEERVAKLVMGSNDEHMREWESRVRSVTNDMRDYLHKGVSAEMG
jgi:hypothetical protein